MSGYDVWVRSKDPRDGGALVPYTQTPFQTTEDAKAWARRYIPAAEVHVLPRHTNRRKGMG